LNWHWNAKLSVIALNGDTGVKDDNQPSSPVYATYE
jgi:hypothetical protein